jgi:hypothetical protein
VPSFQLPQGSGEDLGVHRFAVPAWKPGDTIPLGGGNLRIVEVDWNDEDDEVAGTPTVVAEA